MLQGQVFFSMERAPLLFHRSAPRAGVQGAHRAARTMLAALYSQCNPAGMALMRCQLPQGDKTLKDFRLVESQNVRAGRGLWRSPITAPLTGRVT